MSSHHIFQLPLVEVFDVVFVYCCFGFSARTNRREKKASGAPIYTHTRDAKTGQKQKRRNNSVNLAALMDGVDFTASSSQLYIHRAPVYYDFYVVDRRFEAFIAGDSVAETKEYRIRLRNTSEGGSCGLRLVDGFDNADLLLG